MSLTIINVRKSCQKYLQRYSVEFYRDINYNYLFHKLSKRLQTRLFFNNFNYK